MEVLFIYPVEDQMRKQETNIAAPATGTLGDGLDPAVVIADYRLAVQSRQASILGRQEVLAGRAPFGIFGDGKEVAQLALAKVCRPGDWRAGYYRDQTWAFATGMCTLDGFFAQLYADPDPKTDPASAGRQMSCHFSTRMLDSAGAWLPLTDRMNSSSDITSVGAQMPRLLGLAYASKLYRAHPELQRAAPGHSLGGSEVAFGTIGNASTSEGLFWESLNAAGVLQVPLVVSVWDDGLGISVPNELQTVKRSISEALAGFHPSSTLPGVAIHVVEASDYLGLHRVYRAATDAARERHAPALIHVVGMTQPLGHSSSGSHERYKSAERLEFETAGDALRALRALIVQHAVATDDEVAEIERTERAFVRDVAQRVWDSKQSSIEAERSALLTELATLPGAGPSPDELVAALQDASPVTRRAIAAAGRRAVLARHADGSDAMSALRRSVNSYGERNRSAYRSDLYSSSSRSPLRVAVEADRYSDSALQIDGRLVLQQCFDANLRRDPRIFVIGEDVGRLGDVNLVFEGLQAEHGPDRLTDTGIREATILGQGIGAAMRGLRPVVDIQYIDYFLYALQVASDDLATLRYRSAGGQQAPVVIRTKGHRLQGIWHSGSPMAVLLHAMRGIHLAVPRNMVQAAGFYNTFFRGDDPAMVIEVLNGYRHKERLPENIGSFTLPLGVPEVLRTGGDVTVVTYGACCRLALEAAELLGGLGIELEVIDVRTLNPFDLDHRIAASVARTHALLVVDEDVPGGASAFILQQVLEAQGAFDQLDATPRTLTASENRAPVGTDGDYFCKPSTEDIAIAAYGLMSERDGRRYPPLFPDASA